jgi:hypothetical protein
MQQPAIEGRARKTKKGEIRFAAPPLPVQTKWLVTSSLS